jgi:hypothetical protein
MKTSTLTGNTADLYNDQQGKPLFNLPHKHFSALAKLLNHMGTAIALGEKGDLDAAHDFRSKVTRG